LPDEIIQIGGLPESSAPNDSAADDGLRERAATALERALGFVEDYGDELALLRAHVVLEAAPPARLLEALASRQRDEGGFSPMGFVFAGALEGELRAASVDALQVGTLEALSVLAEVRGLTTPVAEKAVEYIARTQRSDGSWGHLDPLVEAADPEGRSERAVNDRLFVTGMLAGCALRTPFVRPELTEWAGRFLTGLWAPERVESGRLSAITAFANFFANGGAPDLSDEALQWCGRELERGFRSHRFEAIDCLRVLFCCDAEALPGASFDVVELLEALLAEQAQDGGFAPLDPGGPPGRVAPTLDALIGIRSLCRGL
jgi:hypothetical protein